MSTNYDRYFSTHFERIANPASSRRRLESVRANYRHCLPTSLDAPILEIGPGGGEFLEFVVTERGYRGVAAIDLSGEAVARLTNRFPNVSHVDNSTEFLTTHAKCFEAIFMMHVLEHVAKPQTIELLVAAREALTPGGTLIIEVPNMANPLVGLNFRYADFTHEVGFTRSSLEQVLRMAGFEAVKIKPFVIPGGSVARYCQRFARGVVEFLMAAVGVLYFGYFEIVTANVVAIATRTP